MDTAWWVFLLCVATFGGFIAGGIFGATKADRSHKWSAAHHRHSADMMNTALDHAKAENDQLRADLSSALEEKLGL